MAATRKLFFFVGALLILVFLYISDSNWLADLKRKSRIVRPYPGSIAYDNDVSPWKEIPSLELVIRTSSFPMFVRLYSTWFLKSLKLFWPEHRENLTLVLDEENKKDHDVGNRYSQQWPYPKIFYRKPGDPSIYRSFQRWRMFLSYFYAEEYTSAEYVGFVDTDTLFTTVVTPNMLFVGGKPTVQARIGQPYFQTNNQCWSDVTEYFLGEKEVLQCMTYFPVIFKVQHVVEFRKFAEKRFGKPFLEIFRKSFDFKNEAIPGGDCVCQYSIICNYLWYHHRDEYDFHLQMTPNINWTGDHRRESQQSLEYFRSIDAKHLIPKPRVSMHGRHYMEGRRYVTLFEDMLREPFRSQLKYRLKEGLCHSILLDRCPEKCQGIHKNSLQLSLYSFEMIDWTWDTRCLDEQRKHYEDVKKLITYNERHGIKMFGVEKYLDACNETFEF